MDFTFEQNEQGNREPVNILGEKLKIVITEEEGGMETGITKRVGQAGKIGRNALEHCATEGC